MAIQANFCYLHLLNDDKSWKLFCHKVFGRDYSPPKLKQIGKNIVRTCGGLPLAIVVLAGFLAKGPKTQQYWRSTVKSLSSEMLKNDEKCLTMVSLSYTHLPHHLKECFLYFGIFPEDSKIIVSELVMLWIAEGFIKPIKRKSLEDVAYEYLMDLVDRNLIMLGKKNSMGKIKVCKIHDLVRDFCIRELKNKELFYITDRSLCGIPVGAAVHLLSIYPDATNIFPCDRKKLSSLLVNSVVNFDPKFHISRQFQSQPVRVIDTLGRFPTYVKGEENVSKFYDLRYFACQYDLELFPSSSCLLQNLQTLILRGSTQTTLKEVAIWNMPKLRHVQVAGLKISDPLEGENSIEILEDLQTLSEVQNFRCSKEFVKRVPNLKKLGMCYRFDADLYHSLSNLADLQKLEELRCVGSYFSLPISMHNLTFPSSLRKLILDTCQLSGEDIHNIGCLPDLKVLKLKLVRFKGVEWEPADGGFLNLKYLLIHLTNLEHWKAASVHFPSLQHLILDSNHKLMEIPFCIGDIPTLQLIKLYDCTEPLVACVKNTRYELWESGIELQVNISYSGVRAKEGFVEGTSKFLELMEKVRERWPLLYNELVKESTKEQERTGGPLVNTKEDYAAKLGELREKLSESGLLLFNDSREYRSKALRDCLGIMGEEGLSLAMEIEECGEAVLGGLWGMLNAIQAATKLPIERDDGRRG